MKAEAGRKPGCSAIERGTQQCTKRPTIDLGPPSEGRSGLREWSGGQQESGVLGYDVSAGVGSESSREADHELQIHPAGWRTGSIDEIGLSIGATEGGVPVISAQQGGVPAGAIPGKYTGLRADASVGVGLAENIGGNNSAFMFQPTS